MTFFAYLTIFTLRASTPSNRSSRYLKTISRAVLYTDDATGVLAL
jgi:hypothetical protein